MSHSVDPNFLLLESNGEKSKESNSITVGLMILLAVAMSLIAVIALVAIISALVRRRATGQLSSASFSTNIHPSMPL